MKNNKYLNPIKFALRLFNRVKIIPLSIGVIVLSLFAAYLLHAAWTPPTADPPAGFVSPPVTGVTAGSGLTGGGQGGGVTLNVGAGADMVVTADTIGLDQTLDLQTLTATGDILANDDVRFWGELMPDGHTCGVGQVLRRTSADNWDCWTPPAGGGGDITAVTAGSGLTGGGTTGNVTLAVGTGAITAGHIATNAVGHAEIATNAVRTTEIMDGQVTAADIGTNAVGAAQIVTNAVRSAEIASGAVGHAEIASGAVRSDEIASGAVGRWDINTAEVQRRVGQSCSSGWSIRTIRSDGSVVCERDDIGAAGALSCTRVNRQLWIGRNTTSQANVWCGWGYLATGGGISGVDSDVMRIQTAPHSNAQAWICGAHNYNNGWIDVWCWANCCKI